MICMQAVGTSSLSLGHQLVCVAGESNSMLTLESGARGLTASSVW